MLLFRWAALEVVSRINGFSTVLPVIALTLDNAVAVVIVQCRVNEACIFPVCETGGQDSGLLPFAIIPITFAITGCFAVSRRCVIRNTVFTKEVVGIIIVDRQDSRGT